MATKKTETAEAAATPPDGTRRCIGSQRFGIEPHDAPIEDFPLQPSQKDGRGRMCAVDWRAYTARLARDTKARKAADQPLDEPAEQPDAAEPTPIDESRKHRREGPGIEATIHEDGSVTVE